MTCRGLIWIAAVGIAVAGSAIAEPMQRYTVQKGDGLDAIARRHHTTSKALLRLNPLITPDNLAIGAVVRIPAVTAKAQPVHHPTTSGHPAAVKPIVAHRPVSLQSKRLSAAVSPPPVARSTPASVSTLPPKTNAASASAKSPSDQSAQPASAAAASSANKDNLGDPQKSGDDLPLGRVILDLAWRLAVVLGIAYVAIYFLRGIMGRQVGVPGEEGQLKVLESAKLGRGRAVHLVRLGKKVMVLGSTPNHITVICEVDEVDASTSTGAITRAFSGHLAQAVSVDKGGALSEHSNGGG